MADETRWRFEKAVGRIKRSGSTMDCMTEIVVDPSA